PLIESQFSSSGAAGNGPRPTAGLAALILRDTGLRASDHHYDGWLGLECQTVRSAVWMMRALVATNVLSRREGTVLFVPLNAATDPRGTIVARAVQQVHRCASARGYCVPTLT